MTIAKGEPPESIPNSEVKTLYADDTNPPGIGKVGNCRTFKIIQRGVNFHSFYIFDSQDMFSLLYKKLFLFIFLFISYFISNVYAAQETLEIKRGPQRKASVVFVVNTDLRYALPLEDIHQLSEKIIFFLTSSKIFYFSKVIFNNTGDANGKIKARKACDLVKCDIILNVSLKRKSYFLEQNILEVSYDLEDQHRNEIILEGDLFFKVNHLYKIPGVISDKIYESITLLKGYFSSYIIYVSEVRTYNNIKKRIAIMDYGSGFHKFITNDNYLVATPTISHDGTLLAYLSYKTIQPYIKFIDLKKKISRLIKLPKNSSVTYSPNFSPNNKYLVFSILEKGASNIMLYNIKDKSYKYLTKNRFINTSPSFSPDGKKIVFISDRTGKPNIYTLDLNSLTIEKLSIYNHQQEGGSYSMPKWSYDGRYIAFSRLYKGKFSIGILDLYNKTEKLLTKNYKDTAPSWGANSKVIMFTRQNLYNKANFQGNSNLYVVDLEGNIVSRVNTPFDASAAEWRIMRKSR